MKCSIVLSTYNGTQYLRELLDSLRKQTLTPYEVLISDDCSSDDTVSVIRAYINEYSLENWHLSVNSENKGWRQNFKDLIFVAEGDLIFPCDQDDIWEVDKLERMSAAISEIPDVKLLCCDYKIMYMGKAVKFPDAKVTKISNEGTLEHVASKKALLVVDRPGCTYCITRGLVETMKQIDFDNCPHDALAWRGAVVDQGLYVLHSQFIQFRRHGNNASDDAKRSIESRKDVANYYIQALETIKEYTRNSNAFADYIDGCIAAQKDRLKLFDSRSMLQGITSIKNIRYLPSARTYVADLLSLLKSKR